MAAYDNQPILFNKIAYHGIKTKQGSVVVSQADPDSWILQKDPMSLKDILPQYPTYEICLTDNHTNLVWL